MAYTPTAWTARVGTGMNNFTASGAVTGNITLTPNPTSITQEGTPFTAAAMNNIEGGIVALNAVTTGDITYTGLTSGVTFNYIKFWQAGNVVTIAFNVAKAASTASGSNVATCTLTNLTGLLPPAQVTGIGYYGAVICIANLDSSGNLTIRNATATAATISGGSSISITYVI